MFAATSCLFILDVEKRSTILVVCRVFSSIKSRSAASSFAPWTRHAGVAPGGAGHVSRDPLIVDQRR